MNKKVFLLEASTAKDIAIAVNNEKRDFFASNIMPDPIGGGFVAFCWFEPKLENEKPRTLIGGRNLRQKLRKRL